MPKKKTGARKKAERQREIQKKIRNAIEKDIAMQPCNGLMVSLLYIQKLSILSI